MALQGVIYKNSATVFIRNSATAFIKTYNIDKIALQFHLRNMRRGYKESDMLPLPSELQIQAQSIKQRFLSYPRHRIYVMKILRYWR
ncbi:hypothetical protein A8V49_18160 [Yersinia pestis]|nr:hypothetical protein A8V49_18160 [Yersinia pestis]